MVASTLDLARPVAPSRLVSLDRPLAHAPPRVHLSQATARDVFAPVYIVLLLVILKLLVGEESLPPVPELPPVRSDCAPVDAGVSPRAVCWHYPTRTPLEKTLAYAPANHPAVDAVMRDVLARVEVTSPHPRSTAPVILQGFDDADELLSFYRAEPHQLYAGVLFPRLLDGEKDEDAPRLDEPFSVLVNGSYVPLPRATGAGRATRAARCFDPTAARTTPARAADDFPHFARR